MPPADRNGLLSSSLWGSVDTLSDLCVDYIISHLESISVVIDDDGRLALRDGITLPLEICQAILHRTYSLGGSQESSLYHEAWKGIESAVNVNDRFLHVFRDTTRTRLRRVLLRNVRITDESLGAVTRHPVTDLDISGCRELTYRSLELINRPSLPLKRLVIGNTRQVLRCYEQPALFHSASVDATTAAGNAARANRFSAVTGANLIEDDDDEDGDDDDDLSKAGSVLRAMLQAAERFDHNPLGSSSLKETSSSSSSSPGNEGAALDDDASDGDASNDNSAETGFFSSDNSASTDRGASTVRDEDDDDDDNGNAKGAAGGEGDAAAAAAAAGGESSSSSKPIDLASWRRARGRLRAAALKFNLRKLIKKPSAPVLNHPGLLSLCIHDVGHSMRDDFSPKRTAEIGRLLLAPLTNLSTLDFSGWRHFELDSVRHLHRTLQALVLYNVPRSNIEKGITIICSLRKLRHLDISQCGEAANITTPGAFSLSATCNMIPRLVENLSELRSLDLSGTNLTTQSMDKSEEDSPLMRSFYRKHHLKDLKEQFHITESILYDRLLRVDRRTTISKNGSDGWKLLNSASASQQLDRRKRYLSWGDEEDQGGARGKIPPMASSYDASVAATPKWPSFIGRLLPTDNSTIFLEPIRPPLDFLGLMQCKSAEFRNLPARRVAGHHYTDGVSHQVLNAVQLYQEKPDLLVKALQILFQIFRAGTCEDVPSALDAILTSMERHAADNRIQISGSASLFYIVKTELDNIGVRVKRRIVRSLLTGMEFHGEETTMLRNACLTISHFDIPRDMLFAYDRVVPLLLNVVRAEQPDQFVQRIGIFLLNSLACQVEGDHKLVVGLKGGIDTMLDIIKFKLDREEPVCDEVLEIAWSTMWNVTDETAENCARFLERGGMELFVRCLETFPDKAELLRNMLGLLGNVAEVKALRPQLMNAAFLSIFSDLLESHSDGIEVSYNAAGVLSHVASDGQAAWTLTEPENVQRKFVLQRMVKAIEGWELNITRNINYRSFEPILRLVQVFDTPEVQHWAVWALANLTSVYAKKYCRLIRRENGEILLRNLLEDPRPYEKVKCLAKIVLDNVEKHRERVGDNDDYDEDNELVRAEEALNAMDAMEEGDDDEE